MKYLFKSKDLKLDFNDKKFKINDSDCMIDSNIAGENIDRESTAGYIIGLSENLAYWKTRKQNTVTRFSIFAEYTALSEVVVEVLFLKNLFNESFQLKLNKSIIMYEDNKEAVSIEKFRNFTKNSKLQCSITM